MGDSSERVHQTLFQLVSECSTSGDKVNLYARLKVSSEITGGDKDVLEVSLMGEVHEFEIMKIQKDAPKPFPLVSGRPFRDSQDGGRKQRRGGTSGRALGASRIARQGENRVAQLLRWDHQ